MFYYDEDLENRLQHDFQFNKGERRNVRFTNFVAEEYCVAEEW